MRQLIAVGLGGMLGAIMRYLFTGWFQTLSRCESFPAGTVGVNVLGCFILGVLGGFADNLESFTPEMRSFLMIGILGSFTTFSTFEYETLALMRDSQFMSAAVNIVIQLAFGLFAVWSGYTLSTIFK